MGLGVALGAAALRAGGTLARAIGSDGSATRPFSAAFLLIGVLPILGAIESARLKRHAGSTINVTRPRSQNRSRGRQSRQTA
jgi:hypothetical protein